MKKQLDDLLCGPDLDLTSELRPDQMLLMGFNGLFTQLGADFDAMMEATGSVEWPDAWRRVDIIKDAQAIQVVFSKHFYLNLLENNSTYVW